MGEWKEYSLGDLGTVITGKTPSSNYPDEFGSDIPFVTPSDYGNYRKWATSAERGLSKKGIEKLEEKVIPQSSLLVTCIGSDMGKVVMNKIPVITNQQINSIIPNKKVDPNYFYYKLLDIYGILRMYGLSGTAVPILNKGDFEKIEIEIPIDISEQTAIVSVLSSLDDKIDLLHRQNKTLEQLAETLFRQWFVPARQSDSGGGTIEDEFDFTMGQSPIGEALNELKNGVIFFQGRTDFGFRFPEPRIYTTTPTRLAKKYDTLVSVRAPVGDMNMAIEDCCIGRGVAAFRYKHNNGFYSYAYYKLRSLMQQIKQFEDSGTVFGSIGKEDFKKLENVMPKKELIMQFQEKAKSIDEKIFLNTNQIRTLTNLRDTLLPKLMNGEVHIVMDK